MSKEGEGEAEGGEKEGKGGVVIGRCRPRISHRAVLVVHHVKRWRAVRANRCSLGILRRCISSSRSPQPPPPWPRSSSVCFPFSLVTSLFVRECAMKKTADRNLARIFYGFTINSIMIIMGSYNKNKDTNVNNKDSDIMVKKQ